MFELHRSHGGRMRRWAMLMLAASVAACADAPTGVVTDQDTAELVMSANLAGTSIATIVAKVSAPDLAGTLVFNLEIVETFAQGTLKVPPGQDRLITVQAFDAAGQVTHEGQTTVDVVAGQNAQVNIILVPRSGRVPVNITVGALGIAVIGYPVGIEGQTMQLDAIIFGPDGNTYEADVEWATDNPALATVDPDGLVTFLLPGVVNVHASIEGYSGSTQITIVPPGHGMFQGQIISTTGDPVFASLSFDSGDATWTDENGFFSIVLPVGSYTFSVFPSGCLNLTDLPLEIFEGQQNYWGLSVRCDGYPLNELDVTEEADLCSVSPPSITIEEGATFQLFGRLLEAGITEGAGAPAGVLAEFGIGAPGSDPRTSPFWSFLPATYNAQIGNEDEWQSDLLGSWIPAGSTYAYTFRVSRDAGSTWTYCDVDGAGSNPGFVFTTDQVGHLQVDP